MKRSAKMTGEDFRAWRSEMNWTQRLAANEFDVTERTIRNWENGATDVPKAVATACVALKRRGT